MRQRFKEWLWRFFLWLDGVPPGPYPGTLELDVVRYFVAYNYTCGRYLNGARTPGFGMSMVEVPGGIRSWEQILAIRDHLAHRCEAQDCLPYPQVTITNIIEVNRWKTNKETCPRGR